MLLQLIKQPKEDLEVFDTLEWCVEAANNVFGGP